MASIMPKFKLYTLISIFSLLINIVVWIFTTLNFSLITFATTGVIGGFIPFVSLINLAVTMPDLPSEIIAIIGVFTLMFSIIQTFLIIVMIANVVPTENV